MSVNTFIDHRGNFQETSITMGYVNNNVVAKHCRVDLVLIREE